MKPTLFRLFSLTALCLWGYFLAAQKGPEPLYDEAKVPAYTLPDPLVLLNGQTVGDAETWRTKRRPEILKLFEDHVYGKTMIGRPEGMTWERTKGDSVILDGRGVTKTVSVYFLGDKDGPKMDLQILLPGHRKGPVPVIIIPEWAIGIERILGHGYGVATFRSADIEPDISQGSYEKSIRKVFAKPGQTAPEPGEWGAIGASIGPVRAGSAPGCSRSTRSRRSVTGPSRRRDIGGGDLTDGGGQGHARVRVTA